MSCTISIDTLSYDYTDSKNTRYHVDRNGITTKVAWCSRFRRSVRKSVKRTAERISEAYSNFRFPRPFEYPSRETEYMRVTMGGPRGVTNIEGWACTAYGAITGIGDAVTRGPISQGFAAAGRAAPIITATLSITGLARNLLTDRYEELSIP